MKSQRLLCSKVIRALIDWLKSSKVGHMLNRKTVNSLKLPFDAAAGTYSILRYLVGRYLMLPKFNVVSAFESINVVLARVFARFKV